MIVTTIYSKDKYDNQDDSLKEQTCWTYGDWDNKALKREVTEGNVFTAKEHEPDPRTEELPTLEQFMAEQADNAWKLRILWTSRLATPARLPIYSGYRVAHRRRATTISSDILTRTNNVLSTLFELVGYP